mmetsp:Transcript_80268/g.215148  ORF Transcript_80268/g.215148 Transcript_80268/m.215148 type:complete len:255 (+) Transcript_80268:31-795(+)
MVETRSRRRLQASIISALGGMAFAVCIFLATSSRIAASQDGTDATFSLLESPARYEELAYKFTPEDNPLEDFDSDFKAKKYTYKEEVNPFNDFNGYGFSTQSHAKGAHPYPLSSKEDTLNVFESLPAKYPFDERKDGLKEKMHAWQHFDWKKSPSEALKEANVWDSKGKDSGDNAWQLGDKMSFKWQRWEDNSLDQDTAIKALKETNVWDSDKIFPVKGYKWSSTPNSVVQDPNEADKPGNEKNIFMDYKFPNY